MSNLFEELKRRNVFKVAIVYVIAAWLILQVADIIIPALGIPDWGIRFIMVLLGLGFPIAVIFAWAFEMTPEGLKKEKDVDRSKSITSDTGRKIDFVIIGMLVLAVGYFAVDKFFIRGGEPQVADSSALSIAVLPFANMSNDPEQEYFSDGMAEELLNLLAKIPDFKVAGRTSSFAFKGKNEDLRIIAEKLGVENILEGSIRKEGNRVRVTAQLVKADDGFHLWSETYDRELSSIFALQDELATAVVNALKQTLLGGETVETVAVASTAPINQDAYDLVLKGRYQFHQRTGDSLARAEGYFQQAIDLDPGYAPAYSGLALTMLFQSYYSDRDPAEAVQAAEPLITKAIELDPDLADAWAALGLLIRDRDFDFEASRDALKKAVELNPRYAMAHMWLANQYGVLGQPDLQLEHYRIAREIEPLHPTVLSNISNALGGLGRAQEALEAARELAEMYPERGNGQARMGLAYLLMGRRDEAIRWSLEAWRVAPERITSITSLPTSYLILGDDVTAEAWTDYAETLSAFNFPVLIARANLFLVQDELDEYETWARQMAEEREGWFWDWFVGSALAFAGDLAAAREAFDTAYGEELEVNAVNASTIPDYAFVLMRTGDEEKARRLLQTALRIQQEQQASGAVGGGGNSVSQARIHAVLGDSVQAIAALRRAVAQGNRSAPLWKLDYALESLFDDIGYIGLVEEVEAELAEQRAALEADGLMAGPDALADRETFLSEDQTL